MRKADFNSSSDKLWEEILNAGLRDSLHDMFSYQSATDGIFDEFEIEDNKETSESEELSE